VIYYRKAPRKLVDAFSDATIRLLCGATAVWLFWQERSSTDSEQHRRYLAERCRADAEECWGVGKHVCFYNVRNT
jgi:hypothetical protein